MGLDSLESLELYTKFGVYATKLSEPKNNKWKTHHEGTFADFLTMKVGDNIYFFKDRKIYGIGELYAIGGECKYKNFPNATIPNKYQYSDIKDLLLWDEKKDDSQRVICLFRECPKFFRQGIDMDDVLASNPSEFRSLRVFWKLSFIKLDDDENQALKDVILRLNKDSIDSTDTNKVFLPDYSGFQDKIYQKLNSSYQLNSKDILYYAANRDYIRHEMAIEAGILDQLTAGENNSIETFGHWDYLSHQVHASPFKPVDYMDKMDVFGYAYLPGFPRTKYKFLVIEIKRDAAFCDNVDQLMKYVDWIKEEYSYGDYSMIEAYLVAYNFSQEVIDHAQEIAQRTYIFGRRPARSKTWNNLKLIKYSFNETTKLLEFTTIS